MKLKNSTTDDDIPAKRHAAMTGFFTPAKPASMAITWVQRLERVFTNSRRHEAKGFVRVTDKVTSTLSTHHIAATKSSGRLSACLGADCDWQLKTLRTLLINNLAETSLMCPITNVCIFEERHHPRC